MSSETSNPTGTRRSLLASAAAGIAAAVAATIGRASPVLADPQYLELGTTNSVGTGTTVVDTYVGGGSAFTVNASGATNGLYSAVGHAIGVYGSATDGPGVQGVSTGYHGVYGVVFSAVAGAGAHGASYGGTGIFGWSKDFGFNDPTLPAKTGVYGTTVFGADGRGVTGEATSGRGVNGIATSGTGVYGTGTGGEGVRGVSNSSNGTAGSTASGIASGVYGENTGGGFGTYGRSNSGGSAVGVFGESTAGTGVKANSSAGLAFEAQGRVKFSTAGLVPVAVGGKSKVITPFVDVSATSLILCTLETNQAGLSVGRVTKNVSADTFTVFLTQPVASGKTAKIAWFLIG